jgi:hypothetical protein
MGRFGMRGTPLNKLNEQPPVSRPSRMISRPTITIWSLGLDNFTTALPPCTFPMLAFTLELLLT